MIKMMIVDDEKIIREGLRDVIDWKSIGVQVVACLEDGTEALEYFKNNDIDIILSDIVMPDMDGITLCKNIRAMDTEVRIIIISAYQELEYIRAAFRYEAVDYILKPFNNDGLMDVVKRSIDKLQAIREKANAAKKIQKKLNDSLPAISQQFWRDLVNNRKQDINKIEETISLIDLPFSFKEDLLVLICDFDEEIKREEDDIKEEIESLLNQLGIKGISEKIGEKRYIAVISTKGTRDITAKLLADRLQMVFSRLNKSATIGIGTTKKGILGVCDSYEEADIAGGHRMILGRNKIIFYQDIKRDANAAFPAKIRTISDDIKDWLETGELSKAVNGIRTIFRQIKDNDIYSPNQISHICSEIYSILYQTSPEYINGTEYDKSGFVQKMSEIRYIDDAEDIMINILIEIDKKIKKGKANANSRIVNKVKVMIRSEYMENLNLSCIAKEVFLTPSYLSTIFKKETGQTVIDYLTSTRISKAKELLKEMDLSNADISEAVGYHDSRYFSRVFKKHVGKSPSEYRKSIL